jgi:fucose permease
MVLYMVNPRSNRTKFLNTLSYFLVFGLVGLVFAIGGPSMPTLVKQTNSSFREFGAILAIGPLGYMTGSWLGGQLFDRFSGHRILALTLLLISTAMIFVPGISVLWVLIPISLLIAIGGAVLEVGSNLMLIWVHKSHVGPFLNGLHFFFGFGALLGPIIAAQIIHLGKPIVMVYQVIAIISIPIALLLFSQETPKRTIDDKRTDNGFLTSGQTQLVIICLLILFSAGIESSTGSWIFTYTTTREISNEVNASYLTSMFWGMLTLGRLIGIPISVRFPPRRIVLAGLIGGLASIAILLLGPTSLSFVRLGVCGLGLSLGPQVPNLLSLAEKMGYSSGKSTGFLFVAIGAGGLVMPVFISQFFESVGPHILLLTIATSAIISLITFTTLKSSKPSLKSGLTREI